MEVQLLVSEKGRLFFRINHDFHVLAISVSKVCDARMFPRNDTIERCFVDEKLLVETMNKELEVVLEGIESVYESDFL